MFQTMSPKVLNIEKLDKKFASLTKSRESIQGLSIWIIRHKEFYKEIVNQWLDALSRDLNALTMFYVANDVIQNCGRKKAPEFREAFATVLERAVSLEKVKEIKIEVTRMLTLWHERSIYDDTFYKKLQDKLNAVEESVSEEEEINEADIIANFKLENLIDSLKKLKTLEDELLEKEAFLEDIEEPGLSNIDNLIVKMESQKELRKVDKFQKLIEDYISLSNKVITAKKSALLNLKYSSIFYSAQFEDAKKVAHAYRIYGKKVKMLEKSLSEKMLTLPEPSPILEEESPCIELNLSSECESPNISVLPTASNKNYYQENYVDPDASPKIIENDSFIDTVDEKSRSPFVAPQNSPLFMNNDAKGLNTEEKICENPTIVAVPKNVKEEKEMILDNAMILEVEKVTRCTKILTSPAIVDTTKSYEKISTSPVVTDTENSSEYLLKSPVISETTKNSSDKMLKGPTIFNIEKNANVKEKVIDSAIGYSEKKNDEEEKGLKAHDSANENVAQECTSSETKESLSTVMVVDNSDGKKMSKPELQPLSDFENIDFLLEKAYDDHHTKTKASFKRKIENLLKLKQSKACKLSNDEDIGDSCQENKTAPESVISETVMQVVPCIVSDEDNIEKKCEIESTVVKEDRIVDEKSTIDVEKVNLVHPVASSSEQLEDSKVDQSTEIPNAKTSDSDTSKNNPLPIQSFPDIPTELLKNILDKHRINMNLSSSAESGSTAHEILSSAVESLKMSDLNQNDVKSKSITNDIKSSSTEVISLSVSESKTKGTENDNQEMLVDENTSSENIKKHVLPNDSVSDLDNAQKSSSTVKSTPFLENLQSILDCFTKKDNAFNKLKCSQTLNNLPSVPLENTLKVYNCIMQRYNADSLNSSNLNNNVIPCVPPQGQLGREIFSSVKANTNINLPETALSIKEKSFPLDNKDSGCISSKNDNLEIMDMEVDSDDEDIK